MRDKPVSDVLINHHRDTLKTLWDTTMRWFAIANGEGFGQRVRRRAAECSHQRGGILQPLRAGN